MMLTKQGVLFVKRSQDGPAPDMLLFDPTPAPNPYPHSLTLLGKGKALHKLSCLLALLELCTC